MDQWMWDLHFNLLDRELNMKSAAIYKSKYLFLIHSYSKTVAGLSIATSPFFTLDITVSASEFINAIKQAVNNSKEGLPHPKDWSLFRKSYLLSIGVKSYNDLQKNFSSCTVQYTNNNYVIIPSENKGTVNGYIDQIEKKVIIPEEVDEAIFFEGIEKAFTYCV